MIKLTSTITLTIFSFVMFAQGAMIPTWSKFDAVPSGRSESWGIDIDDNNDIYWAVTNNGLNQGLDIVCRKFEVGGNEVWTTPFLYGGPGAQHAFVLNASASELYIGGKNCIGLATSCDMLLLQINKTTGNLIWSKTKDFTASGYEEIDGLEIKSDGIYCGGWCQEFNSTLYQNDIGLWKLDFDGNTEWVNHLGQNSTSEHQDGHFVVDDTYIYASGLWGGTQLPTNLHNGYSFVGKFDKTNGAFIDSTLFGYQSNNFLDIENSLGMTSDGTYLYMTGYTTPVTANDWQIFVAKFDKNLNQMWYVDFGGAGTETARAITVKNNIIYVGGLTQSTSLMTGGSRDGILLMLDTDDGDVLSYQTYGDNDLQSFQDIVVKNQDIYITGVSEDSGGTKTSLLLALEGQVNDLTNPLEAENLFSIYPNPASGSTKIEFSNSKHQSCSISIYNIAGKELGNYEMKANNNSLEVDLMEQGELFIELTFKNYRITRKVINFLK